MPNITLPDGSVRSFEQAVTVAEVNTFARLLLAKERMCELVVLPE